jgi:NAD(P)-dependent dehydrogenase (short-subunit alcohol dehydrogenase family)
MADDTITLVTGANKGLDRETARRLRASGHRVYLEARDRGRGAAAAKDLGVTFVQLDVTDDDSVSAAAAELAAREGRLDVLVNNAGIGGPRQDARDYTAADAAEVLLTNVAGNVRVTHAFLPLLERSGNPVIVNVSSGNGSFALFHDPGRIESRTGMPLYAASKAAINMLSARYARLLPGIKINVAEPYEAGAAGGGSPTGSRPAR